MICKNTYNAAHLVYRDAKAVLAADRLDSIDPVSLKGATLSPLPENYDADGL